MTQRQSDEDFLRDLEADGAELDDDLSKLVVDVRRSMPAPGTEPDWNALSRNIKRDLDKQDDARQRPAPIRWIRAAWPAGVLSATVAAGVIALLLRAPTQPTTPTHAEAAATGAETELEPMGPVRPVGPATELTTPLVDSLRVADLGDLDTHELDTLISRLDDELDDEAIPLADDDGTIGDANDGLEPPGPEDDDADIAVFHEPSYDWIDALDDRELERLNVFLENQRG